jgi:hypothetical protein
LETAQPPTITVEDILLPSDEEEMDVDIVTPDTETCDLLGSDDEWYTMKHNHLTTYLYTTLYVIIS